MSEQLPVTKRQLESALRIAVRGMQNLRGMTGTVSDRTYAIDRVAELMLKELGCAYDGYHPIDELLRRFVDSH
jgi:hypothetical protein